MPSYTYGQCSKCEINLFFRSVNKMAGCKKCKIGWRTDEESSDRDDRMMNHIVRTVQTTQESFHPRARRNHTMHGGALKRMIVSGIRPQLKDLTVPIGFAKYYSPVVNPNDYQYIRMSGWRVAVHR